MNALCLNIFIYFIQASSHFSEIINSFCSEKRTNPCYEKEDLQDVHDAINYMEKGIDKCYWLPGRIIPCHTNKTILKYESEKNQVQNKYQKNKYTKNPISNFGSV
ncbi:hypothetical protein COBT_001138 [Conglomerata obtusa]